MNAPKLDNCFPVVIRFRCIDFPSAEHLFQALKYWYPGAPEESLAYAQLIRCAPTPQKAQVLATQHIVYGTQWQMDLRDVVQEYKKRGVAPRSDWNAIRREKMRMVLTLKFTQSEACRAALLATTGDLVFCSKNDNYWGDGGHNGGGENVLGELLTEIRVLLQKKMEQQAQRCALLE